MNDSNAAITAEHDYLSLLLNHSVKSSLVIWCGRPEPNCSLTSARNKTINWYWGGGGQLVTSRFDSTATRALGVVCGLLGSLPGFLPNIQTQSHLCLYFKIWPCSRLRHLACLLDIHWGSTRSLKPLTWAVDRTLFWFLGSLWHWHLTSQISGFLLCNQMTVCCPTGKPQPPSPLAEVELQPPNSRILTTHSWIPT